MVTPLSIKALFILLVTLPGSLSASPASRNPGSEAAAPDSYAWEAELRSLREEHTRILAHEKSAQEALLTRAAKKNSRLVERLHLDPPWNPGYGVLPEIINDAPLATVTPEEHTYSLAALSARATRDIRDAVNLARRATAEPTTPLVPLVDEFERIRKRMRHLAKRLTYHSYWQRAVIDHSEYFDRRNRILALVRDVEALRKNGGSPKRVAGLHLQVLERLVIFAKTPGLAFKEEENGTRILPVTVVTDIDTKEFLASFRVGVEAAFVRSTAARSMHFAVDLKIRQIPPAELYPEGVPPHGSAIDMKAHLARFPKDALVLTTGGKSTHAWTGRRIVLGPAPVSKRSLAHEFGHLIGFNDAYVRGYDGNPRDRFGAILVEWHGLVDNLMGDSYGGRVTEEMIETLIEAYGKGLEKGGTE